jgi:nitric oxide reductase NorQ protein
VVEARRNVTVVLHPLTDDRRTLMLDRTGEELKAPPGFMLVASYNPGCQNVLKRLEPSTRQRFVSISFDVPAPAAETPVVARESGLDEARVKPLVRLAGHIRAPSGMGLEKSVSTRLLAYAATLIAGGIGVDRALQAAVIEPLTDEPDVQTALRDLITAVCG